MHINSLFLFLLVIAAYLNLYLTLKNLNKSKQRTKLPISSKKWQEKIEEENFKLWLLNRDKLKDKKKFQ